MKLAIVYFSQTGQTEKAAQMIQEGMERAGAEVVLIPIQQWEANKDTYLAQIKESCGVVFGTPVYYATEAWQMKQWLDTCGAPLAGKLGGAFSTANFHQGGPCTAISSILTQLLVKGMLVYSGGGSFGKPFIHLGPAAIGPELNGKELFSIFGERFAKKAGELFG